MQKYIDVSFDIDHLVQYLVDKQDDFTTIQGTGDPWSEIDYVILKETLEEYFK